MAGVISVTYFFVLTHTFQKTSVLLVSGIEQYFNHFGTCIFSFTTNALILIRRLILDVHFYS